MKTHIMQKKTRWTSKWVLSLAMCALFCGFAFAQPGHTQAAGARAPIDKRADTQATIHNWKLARDYERQMRYELARQHYLLALASCRSEATQTQLRRELESIDLQIRTMR